MKKINLRPLGDRVIVEPFSDHERGKETKSGIFIPDTAERERPEQGVVVAVGPGKVNDRGELSPLTLKVGDTVLFKKYGPDEVEIDGRKYLVAEENDILAVLEN